MWDRNTLRAKLTKWQTLLESQCSIKMHNLNIYCPILHFVCTWIRTHKRQRLLCRKLFQRKNEQNNVQRAPSDWVYCIVAKTDVTLLSFSPSMCVLAITDSFCCTCKVPTMIIDVSAVSRLVPFPMGRWKLWDYGSMKAVVESAIFPGDGNLSTV